jgi:death on curing protein
VDTPRILTLSEVITILRDQIARYGGDFGVRDIGLVSSAIAVPQASFEGKRLHADHYEMAAAYAFHLSQNHPFVDGNKRVALVSALVFLDLNGITIADPDDRLYPLMMSVACGRAQKPEIATVLRQLATDGDSKR